MSLEASGRSRGHALTDLPWPAVAEHLERDRRLIVPVATCDQHGPHLPIGAAARVAQSLAEDLSAEFCVLRAPPFLYGVNHTGQRSYPGAASLRPKTLHRALNELVAAWAAEGFAEFVMITADPYDAHAESIAAVDAPGARVRVVEALSPDLTAFLRGPVGPEHAGEVLTSLLLHLAPDLVRLDEVRDFAADRARYERTARGRRPALPAACDGVVGHPSYATAEAGERMYEHILARIRTKVFIATVAA